MTDVIKNNSLQKNPVNQKKVRNSNLELLRIISIIMIIAHHYAVHGFGEVAYSFNKNVLEILHSGGKLGVDIFVLISGYYMINSKFTLNKFLKLASEVFTYSIAFFLFFYIFGPRVKLDLSIAMPITQNSFWFITCYVLLMLLTPFLNKACKNMSQKQHLSLIAVLTLMFPMPQLFLLTELKIYSNPLIIFVLLYFIATYVRIYSDKIKGSAKKHITVAVAVTVFYWAILLLLNYLFYKTNYDFINKLIVYVKSQDSIFLIIIATELLIGFSRMKPHYINWVNILASTSFGIYLIHDSDLTRYYILRFLLKTTTMVKSNLIIPHAILSVIIIYCIGAIIDLLRQNTVEKIINLIIDKYIMKLIDKLKAPTKKLCSFTKIMYEKIYSDT